MYTRLIIYRSESTSVLSVLYFTLLCNMPIPIRLEKTKELRYVSLYMSASPVFGRLRTIAADWAATVGDTPPILVQDKEIQYHPPCSSQI